MRILCIDNSTTSFEKQKLHPVDLAYKKALQKGLKDSYSLNCKIEDLSSIAGPIELKEIIAKLKDFQYKIGENFRANFHIHTKASDGRLTPQNFLDQCKEWADYIFKSKSKDDLPPFSASITDHEKINSVKEVIAQISQEPDKYKNFKFVAGCEFLFYGYKEPYSAFEAIGLGFNPFDENLSHLFQGYKSKNQISETQKIIQSGGVLAWAHPIYTPNKINDDFFTFLKSNGINGIEGNYQYRTSDREYVDGIKQQLEPFIQKYNMFKTGGTDSHRESIFK